MTNAALNWYKNNDIKLSVELGGEPLPIELQGDGSYTYACKKKECWFCEMMKPVEPKLIVIKPVEITVSKLDEYIKTYDHELKHSKHIIPQVKPLNPKILIHKAALK